MARPNSGTEARTSPRTSWRAPAPSVTSLMCPLTATGAPAISTAMVPRRSPVASGASHASTMRTSRLAPTKERKEAGTSSVGSRVAIETVKASPSRATSMRDSEAPAAAKRRCRNPSSASLPADAGALAGALIVASKCTRPSLVPRGTSLPAAPGGASPGPLLPYAKRVSTLAELIEARTQLDAHHNEWLHQLVGDWQIISDLTFADLLLCVPMSTDDFLVVAHCRPSTGPTVHYEDTVGRTVPPQQRRLLRQAMDTGEICRATGPRWIGSQAVREAAIPVVHEGEVIAVISRQASVGSSRTSSRMELNYVEAGDAICSMIARGEFPQQGLPTGVRRGAPRVGDGLFRLGPEGEVLYGSPNALSCFHRLGIIGDRTGRGRAGAITGSGEGGAPRRGFRPVGGEGAEYRGAD